MPPCPSTSYPFFLSVYRETAAPAYMHCVDRFETCPAEDGRVACDGEEATYAIRYCRRGLGEGVYMQRGERFVAEVAEAAVGDGRDEARGWRGGKGEGRTGSEWQLGAGGVD